MSAILSDSALDQLFREGRTYNGFLDKPVSTEQLDAIWELMKFGPTSANCSPARFVFCVSDDAKAKLAACADAGISPKDIDGYSSYYTPIDPPELFEAAVSTGGKSSSARW